MSDLTGDLLAAVVAATPERKEAALRVLRGDPSTGSGRGRPETEAFLTLREVGRRLGVSACSLWRWQVPKHELGGRPKFKMSEVEAYLGSAEFKRRAADLREQDRAKRQPAQGAERGRGRPADVEKARRGAGGPGRGKPANAGSEVAAMG